MLSKSVYLLFLPNQIAHYYVTRTKMRSEVMLLWHWMIVCVCVTCGVIMWTAVTECFDKRTAVKEIRCRVCVVENNIRFENDVKNNLITPLCRNELN